MKLLIWVIVFFSIVPISFSQSKFEINGHTNFIKHGKAVLSQIATEEFYKSSIEKDTTEIQFNKFSFKGIIAYPEQYRVIIYDSGRKYISEPFFIDSGMQTIHFDSNCIIKKAYDIGFGIKFEGSKADDDYSNNFLPLLIPVNNRIDTYIQQIDSCESKSNVEKDTCLLNSEIELFNIRSKRDSIYNYFITHNPQSKISPWLLYELLRKYGYKNIYYEIYKSLKGNTVTSIDTALLKYFEKQKIAAIGKRFPLRKFIEEKGKMSFNKHKFTIVDFWFSNCAPCIAQFDEYKELYKKFNKKGFEILTVSTDSKANQKHYQAILKNLKLPWRNILDIGAVESEKINIHKYPSNFLIDGSGNILFKDVSVIWLKKFLIANL